VPSGGQNKIDDGMTKSERYRMRHKEELRVRALRYRHEHIEERRSYDREYGRKNQEKKNQQRRERKILSPTQDYERHAEWVNKNRDHMKKYQRRRYHTREKFIRQVMRFRLMELLGGRFCKKCSFSDERALQFDHIHGDGYREERKGKKGYHDTISRSFYMKYLTNPELARRTLQVLCANCNWIKRAENREHSHRDMD